VTILQLFIIIIIIIIIIIMFVRDCKPVFNISQYANLQSLGKYK